MTNANEPDRRTAGLPRLPTLRERQLVQDALRAAMEDARRGRGRALFLQGDAGLGKTALVEWARQHLSDGVTVRSARGSAMETDLPLAFAEQFLSCIEERGSAQLGHPGDPLTRRALIHELARAEVRHWARSGPLLVLLDDLHWSDPDSIGVVGFLVRRLSALRVAVVGTLRPWPPAAAQMVEAAVAEGTAEVRPLHPLSPRASGELLHELAGDTVGDDLLQQGWELTGGNPLLLYEAARTILTEGGLPAGVAAHPQALWRPLLLSHFAGLPPSALDVARAASVLGTGARLAAIQAVAEQDLEEFTVAFDTLVAAGVLRPVSAAGVEFTHELLAAALAQDMASAHRRLLHHRAFRHYVEQDDPAAATAHALAADLVGDDQAVKAATAAGLRALNDGAVETSLVQLDAAVTLAGNIPSDDLLRTRADTLFAAGHPDAARDVYGQLLARQRHGSKQVETLARIARAEAYTGRFDAALAIYDQLLDRLDEPGVDGVSLVAERAHVIWERSGAAAALSAVEAGRRRLADARPLDVVASYLRLQTGDPSGLPALERAAQEAPNRLAASPEEAIATFNVIAMQVSAWSMTERQAEALELTERGCTGLRRAGALRSTIPLRINRAGILVSQGKLAEALAEIDDVEEEVHLDALLQPHLTSYRALALVRLGKLEAAASACAATERMAGAGAWFVTLTVGMARGELCLAQGRPEEAWECFRQIEQHVRDYGLGEPCTPRWAAGAIEAALATRRTEDAERVVSWLREHSQPLPCQWPRVVALAGEAGCLAARGEDQSADLRYRQSLDSPLGPLDRMSILLRYGSWLRRRRQPGRARPVLAEALQIAEDRGAAVAAANARAELTAAGGRRRRRQDDDQLTAQERRVARIAMGGATTREIAEELHLSPRTVETHLGRVYLKLGISSKRDLRLHHAQLDGQSG